MGTDFDAQYTAQAPGEGLKLKRQGEFFDAAGRRPDDLPTGARVPLSVSRIVKAEQSDQQLPAPDWQREPDSSADHVGQPRGRRSPPQFPGQIRRTHQNLDKGVGMIRNRRPDY